MAITPAPGYQIDPSNPNATIPIGTTAQAQNLGTYNTGATPSANIDYGNVNTQPAATASTTPAPQMSTPAAPTVTINNTTTPSTTSTSTTTGAPTQQGALKMPTNGSVVDLLNSAGVDSSQENRQKLAAQYGIQNYDFSGAKNQELAQKFVDAYNANKNTAAPQSNAAGRAAVSGYMDKASGSQGTAEQTFFDQYMAMNPVVKTMWDQINNELSAPVTKTSFKDEYLALQSEQGLPALNTELMDIKRVMEGTEDDLRSEIQGAGGIATDSQVQALAGARNKVLLKQASQIQDQIALKNDWVDKLMQFSEMDRADVEKQVDRKLGLTEKLATIQDNITNAARDNYSNLVKSIGFSGLGKLLESNPKEMSYAEQIMGLPQGALKSEILMAQDAEKKLQFISGTDNQASGYFDPATGKFTAYNTGTGSGGTSGGTPISNEYQQALNTILGSGKFTKDQAAAITRAVQSGEDPFTVVKNQAKNLLGQTGDTQLTKYEVAKNQMSDIQTALNKYYAMGGSTNIFSGTMEQTINKLGTVNDPKLVSIATQIAAALQVYRNAVSGTAYSVQEGAEMASIFPGINKTEGLNKAIISGRMQAFDSTIDSTYRSVLGDTYDQLKSLNTPILTDSQKVAQAVEDSGVSYNAIINGAPAGQIAVIDKDTGAIGYIPAEEFTSSYIRM